MLPRDVSSVHCLTLSIQERHPHPTFSELIHMKSLSEILHRVPSHDDALAHPPWS